MNQNGDQSKLCRGWKLLQVCCGVALISCARPQDEKSHTEMWRNGDGIIEEIRMVSGQIADEGKHVANLETALPQPIGHVIPPEFAGKTVEAYGEEQRSRALAESLIFLKERLEKLKMRRTELERFRFKSGDQGSD